ncbi:MAG: Mut7-C RNAse domain-containing protein [Candidatus Bathyarchaeota archaeon]|nr:Mut7-C RNAse domain-containing protein [Candidatus Bathyarchaeota archaeon]
MKFIADGMLGKLTRWLRMLGQDVTYSNKFEDAELIAIAEKEHRILLTRDSELYQRAIGKSIDAFYVEGITGAEKLAELAERFDFSLTIDLTCSRCPRCNAEIRLTPKETLASKVERNTFIYYDEFWKCSECGSIYWQGSHWNGIRATLEEAKKIKS